MAEQDVIYCDDYSRLITYQSRSWTLGDLSLRAIGGIQWVAAGAALCAAGGVTVLLLVLLLLTGLPLWIIPAPATIAAVLAYVRLAKDRAGGVTELERLRLRAHHRYRQPARFNGLAADTEATAFQWDMTLWSPGAAA